MNALTYRCPFCQTTIDVPPDRVDEIVMCANPECGKPFRPDTPIGKLVGAREVSARAVAELQTGVPTAEAERAIIVTHPAVFRSQPLASSGLLLLIVAGCVGMVWWSAPEQRVGRYVAAAAAIVGVVWLVAVIIERLLTKLTVTSKRTMLRRGLLAKHTTEVRHDDVHLLELDQRFFDRVLDVGRISVSSAAGQATPEIAVRGVPRPNTVVDAIRSQQS